VVKVALALVVVLATACTSAVARVPAPGLAGFSTRPEPVPLPSSTTMMVTPLTAALDAELPPAASCLVVTDATTGDVLFARRGDVPLSPASAQKLLTAAAALDLLGPDYHFTTSVVATAPPVAGVVRDLWLVGGGDPLLASPEFAAAMQGGPTTVDYPMTPVSALAAQLVAKGIRSVANGIHGDDSRYETLRALPTWAASINQGELDVGPLAALEVDQGLDHWRPAVPTADPPGHGAAVLARLLAARGVAAAAAADAVAPPGAVVVASVLSAPLQRIVEAMLQASDNQIAELLVREIDRHAGGAGTTSGGVRRVMEDAGRLGLPVDGLTLVDGSGLSRSNRVTCSTLIGALGLGDQPRFAALVGGLPVAGVSGTMATLFRGTPLAGRLAAKGGYITGVTALVGRLAGPRPRRFALVVNGAFSFAQGLALDQQVAETIAGN